VLGAIVRFVVSALVLMVVDWLLPNFALAGFGTAFLAAVAIAAGGWLAESLFGPRVSPQRRGLVGFLVTAAIIYLVGAVVPGVRVTAMGALLASLIIGLIDAVVPTELR